MPPPPTAPPTTERTDHDRHHRAPSTRRQAMGSHGIKDRVAIVGMGCTRFAEHWDLSTDDLLVAAANEAFGAAGIDKAAVDAYWLGTAQSGMSGLTLSKPLELSGKPVVRVENM